MLLVAWLIGSALAGTTLPTLGKEVRSSKVLLGVSRVLPAAGRHLVHRLLLGPRAERLPAGLQPVRQRADHRGPAARPGARQQPRRHPRPAAPSSRSSAPRPSCGKVLEGTGFVFADRRVMTNAHVVGGVDEPTVQIGGEGRLYDATVVLYDWQRDIAVLDVPDLNAPALQFTARGREQRRQRDRRRLPGERLVRRPLRPRPRPHRRQRPGHLPPRHRAAATSTRCTRPSARATPAARCSPRTARCTAWSSPSRSTTPTPATR